MPIPQTITEVAGERIFNDESPATLVTCPYCGGNELHLYWAPPPGSCAGGLLILLCSQCQQITKFYDDYS